MKLVAFLSLLLPSLSFASTPDFFNGQWEGQGTYIYQGDITHCPTFRMEFIGDAKSFEFASGMRNCEKHREEFAPVTMEFRDGSLYFYGQKVGELKDNVLTAWFRAPEEDGRFRNWRMSMRREGQHMVYEESRTMDGETTPLISFTGLLIRKQ